MSEPEESGPPDEEFLRLEYQSLRMEQVVKIRQTFTLIQFALIATGAIWGWIATLTEGLERAPMCAVPVVLAALCAFLHWALRQDVRTLGGRIANLETHFRVPEHLAWESAGPSTYTRTQAVHLAVWALLLVGNIGMAILVCG